MHYIGQSLVALDHRGCHLRWTPSSETDVRGYYVYMSEMDDKHFIRMMDEVTKEPEWNSPPLRMDTQYYFYVTAVDRTGNESSPSAIIPFQFPDSIIDPNLTPVTVIPKVTITTTFSDTVSDNFMTSFNLGG